jgi:hypothetical protein
MVLELMNSDTQNAVIGPQRASAREGWAANRTRSATTIGREWMAAGAAERRLDRDDLGEAAGAETALAQCAADQAARRVKQGKERVEKRSKSRQSNTSLPCTRHWAKPYTLASSKASKWAISWKVRYREAMSA